MGFFVFALPLLVLLAIAVIGVSAVWFAARRLSHKYAKWKTWLVGLVIVFLIPIWDVILGGAYFYSLCKIHGGAAIMQQVELPADHWREDGSPIFLDEKGNKVGSKLDESYQTRRHKADPPFGPFRIEKTQHRVIEIESERILGTYTIYFYFGGWLDNNTALHVSGIHCPKGPYFADFLKQVFVQPNKAQIRRD